MTKQDELLSVSTDTNTLLKQQNRNLEILISALLKKQETEEKPAKIGFVQNAIKGIIENPKTSIAGFSSIMLGVSSKFFPQYAEMINTCLTGITGSGLLIARDAKPAISAISENELNNELLG